MLMQSDQAAANPLDVAGFLHVQVRSQEWEAKEETHDAPPAKTEWNELGLDLEWQVGVDTLLWSAIDVAQQHSGRGLEVSGGSGGSSGSQSESGNHVERGYLVKLIFS